MNLRMGDESGGVLMEYVVALVLAACLLLVALNESFYDWSTQTFGPAGQAVKSFYQRLLGGCRFPSHEVIELATQTKRKGVES